MTNQIIEKFIAIPVPLVGGIAIFFATILALTLVVPFNSELLAYKNTFFGVVILLIVGVIDDRFDLELHLNLPFNFYSHDIFSQGIKIESLNGFLVSMHFQIGYNIF